MTHTDAGNRWRRGLRFPNGDLPVRAQSAAEEQAFWRKRMTDGPPPPDAYATAVWEALRALTEPLPIHSVLEIGPGWGNYTLSLCRTFPKVTCVDISPDNLAYISSRSAPWNPIVPICSTWEDAEVPVHDLVFGYNCLYRLEEPEHFLQKMNDHAGHLCVIGMNCPPEFPWLPSLEAADLPIRYTRQGCRELGEVLTSLGISCKMINIPNHRTYHYANKEAILRRAEQFLMESCPRERLWDLLSPFHRRVGTQWVCEYPFDSQLLAWKPIRM